MALKEALIRPLLLLQVYTGLREAPNGRLLSGPPGNRQNKAGPSGGHRGKVNVFLCLLFDSNDLRIRWE